MKKQFYKLPILFLFMLTACTTPQQAADEICGCLHETVRLWEQDEKFDAFTKFADCGKMQEDYKKQFSGKDLDDFNAAYDACLHQTIKSEMLLYFLK